MFSKWAGQPQVSKWAGQCMHSTSAACLLQWQPFFFGEQCFSSGLDSPLQSRCLVWIALFFSSYLQWAGQPFLVALGWTALPCLVWLGSHNKYTLRCNFVGPKQLERVAGSSGLSSHGCQRESSSCPCKGAATREGARCLWERSCNS